MLITAKSPGARKLAVYVDGNRVEGVAAADLSEGWIELLFLKGNGKPIVDRKGKGLFKARIHTSFELRDVHTGDVKHFVRWGFSGKIVDSSLASR